MSHARRGAALLIMAMLGACAHPQPYVAVPVHPEHTVTEREARGLAPKPSGQAWSDADLMRAALASNPRIAEAQARYRTTLAAAKTARQKPALTLTLTAEYANESPHWGYGAAADIPVDAGLRRNERVTTADLQALSAWYDYVDVVWSVSAALQKARLDRQGAELEIAVAQHAADLRRQRLAVLERRIAAGQDARGVGLTAQAELIAAEHKVIDAQARREAAVQALAAALAVNPSTVRGILLASPGPATGSGDLAGWRRDAALTRAEVLKAIADYDLAESALRLEVAKQYPEVRLGPAYMYDHGVSKLPFTLSLVLPPPDRNRRAIEQAEASRAAAGRSLEAVQAQVLARVDTAAAAAASARIVVEHINTEDIANARRSAALAQRLLAAGQSDRAEALAAEAAVVDAELALVTAQHATAAAEADLEDALRRPFDPALTSVLREATTVPGGSK